MRKKLLPILALSILVTSTLVGCGQASSTPSTLTILSITEGNVFVMKAGTDNWIEAEAGMSLEAGDTIKTGDDSGAEITFFDGSTMELEAGTEIEITSLDVSTDTGATTVTLMQTIGTTISRVTKLLDPASSYEVETPTGVAAVRGSVLIVHVAFNDVNYEDGTTWITNQEGDIYAIAQGVELQVPEGQTCIIIPDQPPELIPSNHLPVAVNDSAITDEDTPVTVAAPGVLNNDSDPDVGDTLAVTSVNTTGTVGAVTAWDADGSFTYDPNGQFEYLPAANSTTDSFTYTVSDGNGGTDTATVTITINGVNDPPVAVTDSYITNEDTPITVAAPGVLNNDSDPDAGDALTVTGVYNVIVGGVTIWSNGYFTYYPDGQFEYLPAGNLATDSFTYTVSDGNGGTDTADVTITINGVNDAPANISLDNSSIAENQPSGTAVGNFSTSDPDTGDTFTYTLVSGNGSMDNGSFNILGSSLRTSAGFDYETKNSYSIRVRSTDQGGLWFEKQFTITVTNVNETPTDISLSPSTVAENEPVNTVVGTLSTTDPDAGDTFTYTLVSGNGSMDNGSFNILGSSLKTSTSFDYETKNTYSIRVRSTDQGGLWVEKQFAITVTNVNETPTDIVLSNSSVAENQPINTVVATLSTTDPDPGNIFTYTLVSGNGSMDNSSFNINSSSLRTSASFSYETKNTYSIRVRSTDQGGLWVEKQFTITVTNVNETPTDIVLSNSSVAENQPINTVVGTLSTTDPDTGDTFTCTLVSGTGDTDNGFFNILGSSLRTSASFDYATKNSYSIRVRANDQDGFWVEKQFTITITDVNDPPVAVDDSAITPQDTPVTIHVLNNDYDADGDTLTVNSITQGAHGSVTNNGNNVTYTPALNFNGADSFTYTISDGNGGTDTATVTVAVTVIETLARINVQIDTGPTASIYIWDATTGGWATDEDTGKPVDGSNHVTSDTIKIAGGHYYCVWVGAADAIYYVKHCPTGWVTSTLEGGGEAACGYAVAGHLYPIHFSINNRNG